MSDKEGDLMLWHNPDFVSPAFEMRIKDIDEGKKILAILAAYDIFLGDLIGCNAQGILKFEDGEWCEVDDDELEGEL